MLSNISKRSLVTLKFCIQVRLSLQKIKKIYIQWNFFTSSNSIFINNSCSNIQGFPIQCLKWENLMKVKKLEKNTM